MFQARVLELPSPGDLPDPGVKPKSPAWQADSLPLNYQGSPNAWTRKGKGMNYEIGIEHI